MATPDAGCIQGDFYNDMCIKEIPAIIKNIT